MMNKKKYPYCKAEILTGVKKCQNFGEWLNDEHTPGETAIISVFSSNYEIIEEIGRGGMSTLFKARFKKLLKVIPKSLNYDKEFIKPLFQEVKYTANPPNIITIYDIGEIGGSLHFYGIFKRKNIV